MSRTLTTAEIDRLLPLDGLSIGPEERDLYNNVSVFSPADPIFAYSLVLPNGWYRQDSPPGDWAVSEDRFATLGVFTPEERALPPIVVSCGVIRMPEGASITACFEEHCRVQGYEILVMRPQELLAGPVIEGLVRCPSAAGDLTMRLAMFEDGGHLFGLSAMAPSATYPEVVRDLSLAICTFELQWPSGPTAPLA